MRGDPVDSWSVIEQAAELAKRGEEFALATVVWRQGPSSGHQGSRAIVTASGEIHGWDAVRRGKVRLLGEERDGASVDRGRWYTRRVVDPTVMLDELEARGWLPALYFIFSRAGGERAMETARLLRNGLAVIRQEQAGTAAESAGVPGVSALTAASGIASGTVAPGVFPPT